jgi:hypothetical protein
MRQKKVSGEGAMMHRLGCSGAKQATRAPWRQQSSRNGAADWHAFLVSIFAQAVQNRSSGFVVVKISFEARHWHLLVHLTGTDLDGFVDGPFRLAPSCFNSDMGARWPSGPEL